MQTCKTCRHWEAYACDRGTCHSPDERMPTGTDEGRLFTPSGFGCIAHEPDAETVQEDDGA